MSEVTARMPLFEVVGNLTDRRKKLIQRAVVRAMRRRGMIDDTVAGELEAMDWQTFFEWILENGPAIIEFIMSIIALFAI